MIKSGMFLSVLFSFLGMTQVAVAANCDQFNQYPVFPGDGPNYSDTSAMPKPTQGLNPVVQWTCFFVNPAHILNLTANLVTSKGEPAPYVLYDVAVNRMYYPGQTAVKLSFQRLPSSKPIEAGLTLRYSVLFEKLSPQTQLSLGSPAIACGSTQLCVGISPDGELWLGNPRGGMVKHGNLYGSPPSTPKQFSVACSEPEYCVAFDSDGNLFSGAIRDRSGDYFRKR